MNATVRKAVCLLLCCPAVATATDMDNQLILSAKHFLTDYFQYTNTRNINDLLKLYSDDAAIKVTVITLNNAIKSSEINGQAWKQLMRESWDSRKTMLEPAELHNVNIQSDGISFNVTAQRYSQTRCYWDNNYKISFIKSADGEFRITKESLYIDHKSQCQAPDSLTINQDIKINQN